MSADLRVAVCVAALFAAGMIALVTSGVVVIPSRIARRVRAQRWRWGPGAVLGASVVGVVLLPVWPGQAVCLLGAGASAVALLTRPQAGPASTGARRAAPRRDVREGRRDVLLVLGVLLCGVGVTLAAAATQA
jgi:hypothetical protein